MKIVDLSCDPAARFAAKLFAMAGLGVTRPIARTVRPALAPGKDYLSIYLDAGKTLIDWTGPEMAAALMSDADVVFVSFDEGRHSGLAEQLLPLAPADAIIATTSTFGTTGPRAQWRGGPMAAWAASGYLALTGDPDREPLCGPEELCFYTAGYAAAIAVEAALRDRAREGHGRAIDISAAEAILSVHQTTFSKLASGEVRGRTGIFVEVYPLRVYPCADGYVSLSVSTDDEFDRLCIAMNRLDFIDDPRFAGGFARKVNAEAIDEALLPFFAAHTASDLEAMLQANGIPAVKAVDPLQLLDNPQLRDRGFWARPEGLDAEMPGNPIPAGKVFAEPAARPVSAGNAAWPAPAVSRAGLPLKGVRVLDFTAWWAGPSATRFLGDLGADIIWVERPNSRLDWTAFGNDTEAVMQELYQWKMYRHKRSVVLDLRTDEHRDILLDLAAEADLVVENFRPGVTDRLGIGPSRLCALNPRLVYVSLSGFGSEGPWSSWRSYGPNIEPASSISTRSGYRDGPPMRLAHALPDAIGGFGGVLATLRGLRERETRGCGAWYDLSQLETYAVMSGKEVLAASAEGGWSGRIGNRSRQGAIQGVYPCAGEDEWIAIRLSDKDDVARFAAASGLDRLPWAAKTTPRDDDAIDTMIAGFTSRHGKHALAETLQKFRIEAMPVLMPSEIVADQHEQARGFFMPVSAGGTDCAMPGNPIRADRPLTGEAGAAPLFGEHTAAVVPLHAMPSDAGPRHGIGQAGAAIAINEEI